MNHVFSPDSQTPIFGYKVGRIITITEYEAYWWKEYWAGYQRFGSEASTLTTKGHLHKLLNFFSIK